MYQSAKLILTRNDFSAVSERGIHYPVPVLVQCEKLNPEAAYFGNDFALSLSLQCGSALWTFMLYW